MTPGARYRARVVPKALGTGDVEVLLKSVTNQDLVTEASPTWARIVTKALGTRGAMITDRA